MPGPLLTRERGQERRIPVGGDEWKSGVEGAGLGRPLLFSSEDLAGQVLHGVGDESTRQPGLECAVLAVLAVLEHALGELHGGRCVGDVVGDDLAGIDVTAKSACSSVDDVVRGMHRIARRLQIRT